MAKRSWLTAFVTLILCGCTTYNNASRGGLACDLQGTTTVLNQEGESHAAGSKLLKRWDIPNDAVWDSDRTPIRGAYPKYVQEANDRAVETNPARILAENDTFNNRIVRTNLSDWVRPASCLEKSLLAEQHSRMNLFSQPSEFASFVLLSPDRTIVRVYYYTVNQNGIGKASPLTSPVQQDLKSGWKPLFALHNHPIVPGDRKLNGAPSPSVPDADFQMGSARYLGLPEARITNGFNSVHMPATSFAEFRVEGAEAP